MHEKSPCCDSIIWRFGQRRRRCSSCLRTWRVWTRKTGRPRLRLDAKLVQRVLLQRRSLTELAKASGLSRQALCYRFMQALERQAKRSTATPIGPGELVLLIDGLWFRFNGRPWVVYLMALKPVNSDTATFIDPVILRGRETRRGWQRALEAMPLEWRVRIRAVVSDNFGGCTTIAKTNGWVLQLCQFHLLAQLRSRIGIRRPSVVTARSVRKEAYELIRVALVANEGPVLKTTIERLIFLGNDKDTPWRFANIVREFIRRLDAYRAYKLYPEYRLPNTTGSVESMGRVIRDLMRRTRSLSTPDSLIRWLKTYIRLRPTIVCNEGRNYTN